MPQSGRGIRAAGSPFVQWDTCAVEAGDDAPLAEGRGLMFAGDFAREVGIALAEVEALVNAGRIEGVYSGDGRLLGIFDDVVPSAEALRVLGVTVSDSYDAEALRSHITEADEDTEQRPETGSSWSMSWPE